MTPTLIVLGTVVTIVALVGGAWAVLASDFVQSLLIMTITIVVAVAALSLPAVGGVAGLVHHLPAAHFHPSQLERPWVIVLWVVAQSWFKFADSNGIEGSSMYLMAKSDRDARRTALIPIVGTLVGPLIWFVPSLVATVTHPNLAAEFPGLAQPHEAAFVAVARDVMPVGMVGLLMCTMFGATLTSMDASLNKNVGVFVRSFYGPVVAPRAGDRHLLLVSKGSTLAFGAIVIATAVFVNRVRTVNLFDLTNLLAATLLMPLALPLVFGLFVRRTPDWIAGSTAAVGFAVTAAANRFFDAAVVARRLHWSAPPSAHDAVDLKLVVVALASGVTAAAWYFGVAAVHRRRGTPEPARLAAFFRNFDTPVDALAEGLKDQDATIYTLMGRLCLTFGAFVLSLAAFVPNRPAGRLSFVFCGGAIFAAGYVLARQGKALVGRRDPSTVRPRSGQAPASAVPAPME